MDYIVNDIGRINMGNLVTYAGVLTGFLLTVWMVVA